MNLTDKRVILFILLIIMIPMNLVKASDRYSIDWYTIDGGSSTSSCGQYQLTGTIGQMDTAQSRGSLYRLFGGFWPGTSLFFIGFHDFIIFSDILLYIKSNMSGDYDNDIYAEDFKRLTKSLLKNLPLY
jgi:hypothetical protein